MALAIHEKLVNIPFMSCEEKFPSIYTFDTLLNEALNIAEQFGIIIGEQGWFRILEFVNSFEKKAPIEINNQLKKRSIEDKLRIERVVDFLEQRKFILLRNLPENISLQ